MTEIQKKQIAEMRQAKLTFNEISNVTGIPVGTLKSFCRRNVVESADNACLKCGMKLQQTPHKRKKKFCSDKCRLSWWKDNRNFLKKKAMYVSACKHCGKSFESYGNSHRIYCSRKCYADARREGCTSNADKKL